MKFYVFFLFVHAMGSSLDYAVIDFFHTGVPVRVVSYIVLIILVDPKSRSLA